MRVLLELRPAFDGHSGIPQETRLLFRGLAGLEGVAVTGLLQSSNLVLEPGLPRGTREAAGISAIDRLSKVVVSLQQGPASHRLEWWRKNLLRYGGPLGAALASPFGVTVALTGFDPRHFKDFVWRSMFARTLPVEDIELVTAQDFVISRWPWSGLHAAGVVSSWFGKALYPRLDTRGTDVFLTETPYPGRVTRGTKIVVRYHDAIPLLMPHTIKDRGYHRASHFHALQRNAADGAWFACVSESTRRDLLSVHPELEARAVTIPNMISHHYRPEEAPADRVAEILWSRKNRAMPHGGGAPVAPGDLTAGRLSYLLVVSTIEPRKNHMTLLDAWERLRVGPFRSLNLVCVGGLGWEHEAIMRRFAPWLERGGLHLLENVPAEDLRLLYRHAAATVCPSFGEGFDFSGVEAMRSGGVVVASDIPVHREVYADASLYFSPYSAQEMAQAIAAVIGDDAEALRARLRSEARAVGDRYGPEAILPRWQEFLNHVVAD